MPVEGGEFPGRKYLESKLQFHSYYRWCVDSGNVSTFSSEIIEIATFA